MRQLDIALDRHTVSAQNAGTDIGAGQEASDIAELGSSIERQGLDLATYLNQVAVALKLSGPRPAWVRCEVTRVNRNANGNVYLQLTHADRDGPPARTEAMVWSDRVAVVLGRFAMETGSALEAGMRVLVLVVPRMSVRWGFGLTILDIDPAWTVGESKLVAQAIRRCLTKEGVWERNRKLAHPEDFTSVAVIAPEGSAGLEDFMVEARMLEEHGLCRVDLMAVPFEGARAVGALTAALQAVSRRRADLDAVFVVRGGGAAAALAWINAEDIVRATCLCGIPVITGVGHEVDIVLIDEVANMSFGTPSKAAAYLVDTILDRATQAREAWEDLYATARDVVAIARADADALLRQAVGLGPASTLARGYAVLSADGTTVVSAAEAAGHARLEARFRDGTVALQRIADVTA